MTKDLAIDYCYKYKTVYIGKNGTRAFDCLVELLDDGFVHPIELPEYGMYYYE